MNEEMYACSLCGAVRPKSELEVRITRAFATQLGNTEHVVARICRDGRACITNAVEGKA